MDNGQLTTEADRLIEALCRYPYYDSQDARPYLVYYREVIESLLAELGSPNGISLPGATGFCLIYSGGLMVHFTGWGVSIECKERGWSPRAPQIYTRPFCSFPFNSELPAAVKAYREEFGGSFVGHAIY